MASEIAYLDLRFRINKPKGVQFKLIYLTKKGASSTGIDTNTFSVNSMRGAATTTELKQGNYSNRRDFEKGRLQFGIHTKCLPTDIKSGLCTRLRLQQ